jgi:hypothetical protein
MVHETRPISTEEAESFDPDSPDEQPQAALVSLIERIEGEIRALQLSSFSQADALALGLLLVDMATERNLPVAIDIRRNEHVLFHVSLPGATPDNGWRKRAERRSGTPNLRFWSVSRADSAGEPWRTTAGSTRHAMPPTAEPSRYT